MSQAAQALIDAVIKAVASGDHHAIDEWLAEDVELNTPRFLKPIKDAAHVRIVLHTVPRVVENFHYDRTWAAGNEAIMEFKGNIGQVVVHGLDIFRLNAAGKVQELTVFLRPTKAHAAIAEAEDALIMAQLAQTKAAP
jgi:hypothetical protein